VSPFLLIDPRGACGSAGASPSRQDGVSRTHSAPVERTSPVVPIVTIRDGGAFWQKFRFTLRGWICDLCLTVRFYSRNSDPASVLVTQKRNCFGSGFKLVV
jgi:hypothetical protein